MSPPKQLFLPAIESAADLDAGVATMFAAGYELVSCSVYGDPRHPRFAALWIQRSDPIPFQTVVHYKTMDAAAELDLLKRRNVDSLFPALISATTLDVVPTPKSPYGGVDISSDANPKDNVGQQNRPHSSGGSVKPPKGKPSEVSHYCIVLERSSDFDLITQPKVVWDYKLAAPGERGYEQQPSGVNLIGPPKEQAARRGQEMRSLAIYRLAGVTRMAATIWPHRPDFAKRPDWPATVNWVPWIVKGADSLAADDEQYDFFQSKEKHPTALRQAMSCQLRYQNAGVTVNEMMSVWVDDPFQVWTRSRDLRPDEVDGELARQAAKQPPLFPTRVTASGTGSNIRFVITFGTQDVPALRRWHIDRVGAGSHDHTNELDTYIKRLMHYSAIRAVQLAIVQKGRLVAARAYTLAEDGYPRTTHLQKFRIGSISKIITRLAMLQVLENDKYPFAGAQDLESNLKINVFQDVLPARFNLPKGNNIAWKYVTFADFMTHTTGIVANYQDITDQAGVDLYLNAAANMKPKMKLPLRGNQIVEYAYERNFIVTLLRGKYYYSNFNLIILARAYEILLNSLDNEYDLATQNSLLTPIGVRGSITQPTPSKEEVYYHSPDPDRVLSVVDGVLHSIAPNQAEWEQRPWVRSEYGGRPFGLQGPHGGWAFSAIHLARLLGSLASHAGNPVNPKLPAAIKKGTYDLLFATANLEGTRVTRGGWYLEHDNGLRVITHNGEVQGSYANMGYREDGSAVVVLLNGEVVEPTDVDPPIDAIFFGGPRAYVPRPEIAPLFEKADQLHGDAIDLFNSNVLDPDWGM